MTQRTILVAILWLAANVLLADEFSSKRAKNWHQFRGPEGTGVAPLGNPPTEWSESKNIKWKVEVPGRGSASPVIWGDRIFLLTAIKTDQTAKSTEVPPEAKVAPIRQVVNTTPAVSRNTQSQGGPSRGETPPDIPGATNIYKFVVLCLDRRTGEWLWDETATEALPHEGHHETASFASASPITDGHHVWAFFGSRGIYCFDVDGQLVWAKDLGDMRTRFSFGEGASPALHKNTIVIVWDHEDEDFIVALDALTGDEKWRTPRDEPTTWATPVVVEAAGRTQVITSGDTAIRSYDFDTGTLIWECSGVGANPTATPVVTENLAIVMSGHRDPVGFAIPLDSQGDVTGSDRIAWKIGEIGSYIPSPVLYDDLLYIVKHRQPIISCLEVQTGKPVFRTKRLPDQETLYASPVAAGGRIYLASREGMTVVLKHGRKFEVLARNPLDDVIDATPAIVGDEIYIRGDKHLYAIAEE